MRKECSVKEGRVITCCKCGQSGGTLRLASLRKDDVGYIHHPSCPPVHHKPVLVIPSAQELYAMRQPIKEE